MRGRIRHTVEVRKPPEGAVFKRHGAERSGKRSRLKRDQVSVKKPKANEPLKTCRKDNLVGETAGFDAPAGRNCNGQLFTPARLRHSGGGYRPTGIKTAGALHRLLYGT